MVSGKDHIQRIEEISKYIKGQGAGFPTAREISYNYSKGENKNEMLA